MIINAMCNVPGGSPFFTGALVIAKRDEVRRARGDLPVNVEFCSPNPPF
jgi:hypothetical protein